MSIPTTMKAVVTLGHGDYSQLSYQDYPVPAIGPDEVLLKVLGAGVNNTEINTRLGWYSTSISAATADMAKQQSQQAQNQQDGGWDGATPFPLIQGTDCCGKVVATGPAYQHLQGKRVLVRACMRTNGFDDFSCSWMGSNSHGAFAEYVKVPTTEVFPVDCDWLDAELASIPCAYATAENMLYQAKLQAGETVLVTGASGGVGLATVQLAKRRGAKVVAVVSKAKQQQVLQAGADNVHDRDTDLPGVLGEQSVDLVVDNVAGQGFANMLKVLRQGGRLVSSGAIAGPRVQFDLRDLYLKDITILGTTAWAEPIFSNLIRYIEAGELVPQIAKTFALKDIVKAQQTFVSKQHVGKIVLIP